MGKKLKVLIPMLVIVSVAVILLWPVSPIIEKNVCRYWDNEESRDLLISVENGEYMFLREIYGLSVFDNNTVNKYLDIVKHRNRKMLIELLLEHKRSERYVLNYTALAISGTFIINISILDGVLARLTVDLENNHIDRFFSRKSTLINSTEGLTIGIDKDLHFEGKGYIVFIEIIFEYLPEYTLPVCGGYIKELRELFVFNTSRALFLVSSINTTLIIK